MNNPPENPREGDQSQVRTLVGWRVQHGWLPRADPVRLSASYGRVAYCAACGRGIDADEIEYEAEWSVLGRTLRMHADCYAIWLNERSHPSRQMQDTSERAR